MSVPRDTETEMFAEMFVKSDLFNKLVIRMELK